MLKEMKKNKLLELNRVRDKKLGIYENKVIEDEYGYQKTDKVLVREVWGRVRGIRGREFYQAKQAQALDIKTFNFEYFPGLTASHYIKYDNQFYNIEHPDNIEGNNFEYEVKARLVSSSE